MNLFKVFQMVEKISLITAFYPFSPIFPFYFEKSSIFGPINLNFHISVLATRGIIGRHIVPSEIPLGRLGFLMGRSFITHIDSKVHGR